MNVERGEKDEERGAHMGRRHNGECASERNKSRGHEPRKDEGDRGGTLGDSAGKHAKQSCHEGPPREARENIPKASPTGLLQFFTDAVNAVEKEAQSSQKQGRGLHSTALVRSYAGNLPRALPDGCLECDSWKIHTTPQGNF